MGLELEFVHYHMIGDKRKLYIYISIGDTAMPDVTLHPTYWNCLPWIIA